MARFYFHTDGPMQFRDEEGVVLAGHREARIEAVHVLGDLVRWTEQEFWREGDLVLRVADETGRVIFRLILTAVETPSLRIAT